MCTKVFPTLNCTGWNNTDTDKGMWRYVLDIFDNQPDIVNEYADFTMFLRAMVGTEGFEFLRASTIWQSNFQAGVSAETMLDWLNHVDNPEITSFQRPYRYLKGGMSQYPYRLIDKAIANGARVSTNEAVLSIESTPDDRFLITTTKRKLLADRIINAIDPYAFRNITGKVARDIQNTAEFQNITATSCATVDAWWDERFWERSRVRKSHTLLQISNHAECFNLMETPSYAYIRGSNVTTGRAVYDDGVCIDTWRVILNSGNTSLLMEEIRAGMQRVFTDIVVPLPRTVKGVVHEQAWHNLAALSKFINDDIRKWAIRPVDIWDVSMVGEAYSPAFSAWTEGAVRSTMWTLQERYGFSFPCLESLSLKAVDCTKLKFTPLAKHSDESHSAMEVDRWSRHIKTIWVRPRLRKNGGLSFGMKFYGGSENGMLIRCSNIRKVRYVPRFDHTEATVAGQHLWYKKESAVACEGDIVLYFNGSLCTGMPLDYFLNVVVGSRLSKACLNQNISMELVSSIYFTGTTSRRRPDELANILTLTYDPKSEEERCQGKIRHAAYDLLWPITTHPHHPLNHNINGFSAHYNYVAEADIIRYKAEHRLLESGVSADGYLYGTLLPRPPTYDYSVEIPGWHYGHDELPRTLSYYDALNLEPNLRGGSTPLWPVRKRHLAGTTFQDGRRSRKSSWSVFDKLRQLKLAVRVRCSLWRQRKMASCWDLYEEMAELARQQPYDKGYSVQYTDVGGSEFYKDDPECIGIQLRYHEDADYHFK